MNNHNRVVSWPNHLTFTSQQPADLVHGQSSFTTMAFGTTATTVNMPTTAATDGQVINAQTADLVFAENEFPCLVGEPPANELDRMTASHNLLGGVLAPEAALLHEHKISRPEEF
jgi:hypothetical protein